MLKRRLLFFVPMLALLAMLTPVTRSAAQDGKLKVRANPREAYIFVDGSALAEGRRSVRVSPGAHKVVLYNYGYKPAEREVSITAGKTTVLDVTLEAIPGTPAGPWGCITIEGVPRAAVLLNGKTPDYFVGHGDEFNHEWWWKQELIVPPGTHQLTVLSGDKEIWSGPVTVSANQRVVLDADKGNVRKTVPWPRGERLGSPARFRAGVASAAVVISPVTAQFAANPAQINCGESARLNWSSVGAVKNEISGVGPVPASGEQAVQPKQTTSYRLTATGPGGTASADSTVNVNSAVQASLSISPAEIHYRKVGDKVEEQGSATLAWSAAGADSVTLDPIGSVAASGSRSIQATPHKTDAGPVDETITYTLRGSNACGGSAIQTATLHVTGAIEVLQAAPPVTETTLEVKLSLNSIYFPTALPKKGDLKGGLVASQQARLNELASNFKQYLGFRPEAHLILQAHADKRGSAAANMALSERRAESIKAFLIEQGIAAASIETKAFGHEQNLDAATVRQLTEQNPNISAADRQRVFGNLPAFILANNRRVDVSLSTTGQQSQRFFPYNSEDLTVLMGAPPKAKAPAKKAVPKKK
jgi:outer membrane protein OmpA-like peptidoglycan-associated protein